MRYDKSALVLSSCIALTFVLFGQTARAAFDNSHHDMRRYIGAIDGCIPCHSGDTYDYSELVASAGRVGAFCLARCHSGAGMLPPSEGLIPETGPIVDVRDYSVRNAADYSVVFFTRSHGRHPENLKTDNGAAVPWPPPTIDWPYVASNVDLECTSCHDVHDNRYPPFLRAPLGSSPGLRDGLCERCHADRAGNDLQVPPNGMHPVNFVLDNAASSVRGGLRNPRRIRVQEYGAADGTGAVNVFDVPNPPPSSLNEVGISWRAGGHLSSGAEAAMAEWSAPGAGSQRMGCYTCHAAHRATDGVTKNLVVVPAASTAEGWNPLCTGCHGAARARADDASEWNVGTTDFGHPLGNGSQLQPDGLYCSSSGGFRFRIGTVDFRGQPDINRLGAKGELLCTTCHRPHFGQPASLAVANLGQGTRSACKSCHNGEEYTLPESGTMPPNSHHITIPAVKAESIKKLGFGNPGWWNERTGLGDVGTGIGCADCHVANGTAHNW